MSNSLLTIIIVALRVIIILGAGAVYFYYNASIPKALPDLPKPFDELLKFTLFNDKFLVANLEILIVLVVELIISNWEARHERNREQEEGKEKRKLDEQRRIEDDQKRNEDNHKLISVFREFQHNKFAKIKDVLKEPHLKDCAEAMFASLEDNISAYKSGFEIQGSELVLSSYVHFWDFLIQAQSKRKGSSQPPIFVKLVHACDFGIWTKHGLAEHLINQQSEFLIEGGGLLRFLVTDSSSPTDDCKAAHDLLKRRGLPVEYFKRAGKGIHDFALVEELRIALVWVPKDSYGTLASAQYTDAIKPLQEDWNRMHSWLKDQEKQQLHDSGFAAG